MDEKDKFVLVRKAPTMSQVDPATTMIRVRREAHSILTKWALETNCSMTKLATEAIIFANEHKQYIDE